MASEADLKIFALTRCSGRTDLFTIPVSESASFIMEDSDEELSEEVFDVTPDEDLLLELALVDPPLDGFILETFFNEDFG